MSQRPMVRFGVFVVFGFICSICDKAWAAPQTQPSAADLQRKIEGLQQEVDSLHQQVNQMQSVQSTQPSQSQQQAKQLSDDTWQMGYSKGFYLQDGDDFKITVNGLLDARYTFVHAENQTTLANTALGNEHTGDMSGFNLNTAQVALAGTLYKNIFFKVLGNFGSTSSFTSPTAGTFQLLEYYGGYKFSSELSIRAGAFIIPYVPVRTLANYGGSQFPDLSDATGPFVAGYGLGADAYGVLAGKTVSYDVMVGNGSNSQNLVSSTAPAAGRDNRLSIYTREQYAGAGNVNDFLENEPDIEYHDQLAWILGLGLGWESQNSSANSFPGPRTSTQISGLSAATLPGFDPNKYILDGNLFRAAADVRTKYEGWSTFGEVFYQNISSESGPIIPGSPRMTVGQLGYFLQTGYFIVPKKLDVAARFSQLYTFDFPHHMDEYEIGVDYYVAGENMKIQLAETYIPEAALTSGNGSLVNTQDWITQLQLQVKF